MPSQRRLSRLAYQWGGVALAVQLWVCLHFVHQLRHDVTTLGADIKVSTLPDRLSQLRPPALKAPYCYVYFGLFLLTALAVIGTLAVRGLRAAMAPDPLVDFLENDQ